jgi:glyoxylase-like metal-dependent hydrolase (beta-lactamase superfamily II)
VTLIFLSIPDCGLQAGTTIGKGEMMYEIYALKVSEKPTDVPKVFYNMRYGERVPTVFYFWFLKGKDRNVLVDTGISQEEMECRNISGPTREEMLGRINVSPENVDTIILSHLHGDHFGQPEIYSKAVFYVQRKEVEFWAGEVLGFAAINKPEFLHGKSSVQLEAFEKLNLDGRVRFLDGDSEIYPGLSTIFTGGHTPGHQAIKVDTANGPILLLVDFANAYKNVDERIPVGSYFNLVEWMSSLGRIERMRFPGGSLIPGHDELVMTRFPRVAENVVKIA